MTQPNGVLMGGYLLAGILFSGTICLIFLMLYLLDVRHSQYVPLFSAEWKGLGGGLGGWRISRPFACALLAVVFGVAALALIGQKLQQDHSDALKRAEYDYELRKLRESDERKYHDADLSRQADLEKAKVDSATNRAQTEKKAKAPSPPQKQ